MLDGEDEGFDLRDAAGSGRSAAGWRLWTAPAVPPRRGLHRRLDLQKTQFARIVAWPADEHLRLAPHHPGHLDELVERDAKKRRRSDSATSARSWRTETSRMHVAGLVLLDSVVSHATARNAHVCGTRCALATSVAARMRHAVGIYTQLGS